MSSRRKWATKRDVVREFGVSPRTVDNWMRSRKIPYYKLGTRMVRFDLDKVAEALDRFRVKEVR